MTRDCTQLASSLRYAPYLHVAVTTQLMHTTHKASSRETHRAARKHSKQHTHSWFKKYGQRLAAESSDVTKNASLSAADAPRE